MERRPGGASVGRAAMEGKHRRVGFRILSASLGAAEITRRTGLRPTSVGEIGEPLTRSLPHAPRRQETAWVLDSPLGPEHALEERLEALLALVEPARRRLLALEGPCMLHFFVGHEPLETATVLIDPHLLERIAAIPGEGLLLEGGTVPAEHDETGARHLLGV